MANKIKITGGTIGSNGKQGATTVITNEVSEERYEYRHSASIGSIYANIDSAVAPGDEEIPVLELLSNWPPTGRVIINEGQGSQISTNYISIGANVINIPEFDGAISSGSVARLILPESNYHLVSSSLDVAGNLNFRRLKEKRRYNDWLRGDALRVDLGHDQDDGNTYSTPPEWVQTRNGVNHAFVIRPLSASSYEEVNLNTYKRSTTQLEQTAVPVSVDDYYTKEAYTTKVYALTASADLSGSHPFVGQLVPEYGNMCRNADTGLEFKVNVPDHGTIVNIRVWVEIASDISTPTSFQGPRAGLADYNMALRSPNVSGFMSQPWMNNTQFVTLEDRKKGLYHTDFFKDSFLLMHNDGNFYSWAYDYNIRTIFDDGARARNPRHLGILFASGSDSKQDYLLGKDSPSNKFSSSLGLGFGGPAAPGGPASGGFVSWIADKRIVNTAPEHASGSATPPAGWLSGPGLVNGVNEYPTSGSSWGPNTIKPIYPLLDDVKETNRVREFNEAGTEITITGVRPGLRGTEIHGDWSLIINSFADDSISSYLFFRQFRLEITYKTGRAALRDRFGNRRPVFGQPGEDRLRSRVSASFQENVQTYAHTKLGFDQPEASPIPSEVFYVTENQRSMTVGITADTGSSPNYAVFTRVTGTLADRLTASLGFHNDFLNNEFGTPYIPISSGSGETPSFYDVTDTAENKRIIADTLNPEPIISKATTSRSALTQFDTTKTTRDLMEDAVSKISGSA